jgi:hypothetical protein
LQARAVEGDLVKRTLAAALVAALAATAAAQEVPGAEGPTSGPALGDGPRAAAAADVAAMLAAFPEKTVELPEMDPTPLLEEDAFRASIPGLKADPRVGVVRRFRPVRAPSRLVPGMHGVEVRQDGSVAWTTEVRAPGAVGLRLHVARCDLPRGTELFLYDADDPSRVYGPIQPRRGKDGGFFLPTVFAQRVRVELRAPARAASVASVGFVIDRVAHRYRERGEGQEDPRVGAFVPKAKPAECNNDVACETDFSDVARGVAMMEITTSEGVFLCSGALLNDCDTSTTVPYFLTAHHCVSTDIEARNTEFFFDYRAASCGGSTPPKSSVPMVSGATLLSTSTTADYSLLKLTGELPSNRFFCGWTATRQNVGEAIVGVHNPGGGKMRISFGALLDPDGAFHQVQWSSGVTQQGSSGSPLFNPQKQVIGQLYGGSSSCSYPDGIDQYGRFDRTYASVAEWLGACGPEASQDPYDPGDDSSDGANVLAPDVYGSTHGPHSLSKNDLADWYSADLEAGRRYRFFSIGVDDVRADVYLGSTLVAADDDSAGTGQFSLDLSPASSGAYRIVVTTAVAEGAADYALHFEEVPPARKSPAPVQNLKKSIEGTQVALRWKDAAKNEAGHYVELSEDGGSNWTRIAELPRNERTFSHDPGPGQHVYRVGPWNAAPETTIRWRKTSVNVVDVNQLDAADPRDDVGSGATPLVPASGGTTPEHSLSRSDFQDWYRIDMTQGTTYVFQSLGSGDTYGDLWNDEDGYALEAANDDAGPGKNFRFSFTAPRTATFWLRVAPFSDGAVMKYSLQWFEK